MTIIVTAATLTAADLIDAVKSRDPHYPTEYWTLSRVGDTVFAPPVPIEGCDPTDEHLQQVESWDQVFYVAITVRFGAQSGVSSHGMTALVIDPQDVVHVFRNIPAGEPEDAIDRQAEANYRANSPSVTGVYQGP